MQFLVPAASIAVFLLWILLWHRDKTRRRQERAAECAAARQHGAQLLRYDPQTDTAVPEDGDFGGLTGPIAPWTEILLSKGFLLPESRGAFADFFARLRRGIPTETVRLRMAFPGQPPRWMAFQAVSCGDTKDLLLSYADCTDQYLHALALTKWETDRSDKIAANLFYLEANLTQDRLEFLGGRLADAREEPPRERAFSALTARWRQGYVYAEDTAAFSAFFDRERLLHLAGVGIHEDSLSFRSTLSEELAWTLAQLQLILSPYTGEVLLLLSLTDIDRVQREREQLQNQASLDAMTGLLNRESTMAGIRSYLQTEGRRGTHALFMIDIDNFKAVNDTFGHQMGDLVLTDLARALKHCFRNSDLVGRIGGDEFFVLMKHVPNIQQVRAKAQEVNTALQYVCSSGGRQLSLTVSMGISLCRGGRKDLKALYAEADAALYQAKETGKNGYLLSDGAAVLPAAEVGEAAQRHNLLSVSLLLRHLDGGILLCHSPSPEAPALPAFFSEQILSLLGGMQRADFLAQYGRGFLSGIHPDDQRHFKEAYAACLRHNTPLRICFRLRGQGGAFYPISLRAKLASHSDGSRELYALCTDAPDFVAPETGDLDALTGLYNRRGFFRLIRQRLSQEPDTAFRLIRWDLDNFKLFNDMMGIAAGDKLLRDMGTFAGKFRNTDHLIARLDADHFACLSPTDSLSERALFTRLRAWLEAYPVDFHLSAHMGVYPIEQPALDPPILCDRALLALKSVKGDYTQGIGYYDNTLRSKLLREQTLTGQMAEALRQGQFVLYFQPQVNYENGALIGAEALVRWNHPTLGLLSPGDFIPLFERNGFITTLDAYVWEKSCHYMRTWLDQEGKLLPVSVAVNISRVDLCNPHLCRQLKDLTEKYHLPLSYLRLEITESAYMQNPERLIAVVRDLRREGFTVEMDDFGTGYSSLNILKDVPVNVLKLDMRFLSHWQDTVRGGTILSSVIRMAHWLNMPVIAEGVEDRAQADYLKSLNCFYMQGYYFGKPVPAREFEQRLHVSTVDRANRYAQGVDRGLAAFWDPSAQTTQLFDILVTGAAIAEYHQNRLEILRANDPFYAQLNTDREHCGPCLHFLDHLASHAAVLQGALRQAIQAQGEAACQVECLPFSPEGTGVWLCCRVRFLTQNADSCLFYLSTENISRQKETEQLLSASRQALLLSLSHGQETVLLWDASAHALTLPASYAAQHGLPPRLEDPIASLPVHPEDRQTALAFSRSLQTDAPEAVFRVRDAGGAFLREHWRGVSCPDGRGRPLLAVLFVRPAGEE